MCSPFPSSYDLSTPTLNLLKAKVDLIWGTVIRRHHTSSGLVVQAGFLSQQPLFLFGEEKGSEPARHTGPVKERPARKGTQPERPGSAFITVLVTLRTWERTTLLAAPDWGDTKEMSQGRSSC